MTLEQIKQLSDDEIRIKVAELLGWQCVTEEETSDGIDWAGFSPDGTLNSGVNAGEYRGYGSCGYRFVLPNYPHDLNACAAMEDTLDDSQKDSFEYLLGIVIGPGRERWRWHLLHATARQRCEAFIVTKARETKNETITT